MNAAQEKNNIWYFLLLLPIAAGSLVTIGGMAAAAGVLCMLGWFFVYKASVKAFNAGNGGKWTQYIPLISNGANAQQTANNGSGKQTKAAPQASNANQNRAAAGGTQLWRANAPAFDKQRLTVSLESLKWSESELAALAAQAGENIQYALAFRSMHGNAMPHSQRLASIQMSEIAAHLKTRMPQGALCRAWRMLEVSKGVNMDGLLVVPDQSRPLGLYLVLTGDRTTSRFTVLSMFVPVCSNKVNWMERIYRPTPEELRKEKEMAGIMIGVAQQLAA